MAERVFGIEVRGKTMHSRVARVLDAAYWRHTLRRRVAQEVALLQLKLGRVGKNGSAYCSAQAPHLRATQRQAQARWLEETTLQAVIDGELVELGMKAVAKSARQKLSRQYAFIAAMDLADGAARRALPARHRQQGAFERGRYSLRFEIDRTARSESLDEGTTQGRFFQGAQVYSYAFTATTATQLVSDEKVNSGSRNVYELVGAAGRTVSRSAIPIRSPTSSTASGPAATR